MEYSETEKKVLIHDVKEKITWSFLVRYIVIALAGFLLYLSFFDNTNLSVSLYLMGFVFVYNLITHIFYKVKKHHELSFLLFFRNFLLVLDVLAVTILIYITGVTESPYWFLYLVLIIISGFGVFTVSSVTVFVIAFFSTIFYLGMLWLVYLGVIPVYAPGFQLSQQQLFTLVFNKAVFTTVSFLLFSTTIYYFSQLLRQHREELSHKNALFLQAVVELKDLNKMKDEFISTASHELRTPLAILRENLSLIEDKVVGEVTQKQTELLSSARSNLDRLAEILNNLLDISKLDSHSLQLKREKVDLCALASKAVNFLKPKASPKNINLELVCSANNIWGWVDSNQIFRVFINLIDNAIKYIPEKSVIVVEVKETKREILVSIKDNGPGISDQDALKVFQRFVRLEKEPGITPPKGFGLGLSICKGIVEVHGGTICVDSKMGEGTKFTFTIPKVELND